MKNSVASSSLSLLVVATIVGLYGPHAVTATPPKESTSPIDTTPCGTEVRNYAMYSANSEEYSSLSLRDVCDANFCGGTSMTIKASSSMRGPFWNEPRDFLYFDVFCECFDGSICRETDIPRFDDNDNVPTCSDVGVTTSDFENECDALCGGEADASFDLLTSRSASITKSNLDTPDKEYRHHLCYCKDRTGCVGSFMVWDFSTQIQSCDDVGVHKVEDCGKACYPDITPLGYDADFAGDDSTLIRCKCTTDHIDDSYIPYCERTITSDNDVDETDNTEADETDNTEDKDDTSSESGASMATTYYMIMGVSSTSSFMAIATTIVLFLIASPM